MATFYRGAGVGSHWHIHDSRKIGFTARSPEKTPTTDALIEHIATSTLNSPYISLTRSYAVAWHYAVFNSKREPSQDNPAFIYEIEIDDSLPHGLNLIDPVKETLHNLPQSLRGIIDLDYMSNLLDNPSTQSDIPEGELSPTVELQLIAFTFA